MSLLTRAADITRAAFARTNADLLVNDPAGFPSDWPPVWWMGLDSGGGAYPIGPNGPYGPGTSPARSTVIRATALITGPLTSAPFRVLDMSAAGQPLPTPRWLTDPMLVRPDERIGPSAYAAVVQLTRAAFWVEWLRSAIWYGLGAFVCNEDSTGQPQAGTLRTIHPSTLSTERDLDGSLRWVIGASSGTDRVVFGRDGRVDLGLTDRAGAPVLYRIVVLRNPHSPVDQEGLSQGVFAMSPDVFALAAQVGAYATGQFRSGIPNGYLKAHAPNLTQVQADELKAKWMQAHGGDRRSIAVLNATTEFTPINLSPVDAELGDVKRLLVADVAFAFGLDPYTLGSGMGNSATYTNLQDSWEHHHDFGLAPWIAAVQDTLTALLPGQQTVVVNLDEFANPPERERVETGRIATEAGLYTVNEWRARQGLQPLDQPAEPQPLELVPPQPEEEVAADATA